MEVRMWHSAKDKCMKSNSIHGIKGLQYALKDTKKNRAEAERLFSVRCGVPLERMNITWKEATA